MTQLGSVFEPDDPDLPRGRDLECRVRIHPGDCDGRARWVPVPAELPRGGVFVPRTVHAGDAEGYVQVTPPAGLDRPARLRVRGLGEAHAEGVPGDLLLTLLPDPAAERLAPVYRPSTALAPTHGPGSVVPWWTRLWRWFRGLFGAR
jgi:hypothetical protein